MQNKMYKVQYDPDYKAVIILGCSKPLSHNIMGKHTTFVQAHLGVKELLLNAPDIYCTKHSLNMATYTSESYIQLCQVAFPIVSINKVLQELTAQLNAQTAHLNNCFMGLTAYRLSKSNANAKYIEDNYRQFLKHFDPQFMIKFDALSYKISQAPSYNLYSLKLQMTRLWNQYYANYFYFKLDKDHSLESQISKFDFIKETSC